MRWTFYVILALVAILGLAYAASDCDSKGGVLVQGATGLLHCVKEVK